MLKKTCYRTHYNVFLNGMPTHCALTRANNAVPHSSAFFKIIYLILSNIEAGFNARDFLVQNGYIFFLNLSLVALK